MFTPAGSRKASCKDNTGKRTKLVVLCRLTSKGVIYRGYTYLYEVDWKKEVVRTMSLTSSTMCHLVLLVSQPLLSLCLNAGIMQNPDTIFLSFPSETFRAQLTAGPGKQRNKHISPCLPCASGGKPVCAGCN